METPPLSAVRSEKLEVRNGGGGASNLEAPHYGIC